MLDDRFVVLGAIIAVGFTAQYAYETLKGRIRPNRVTWFLWVLAPAIAFMAQLSEKTGLQSLLTFSVGFGPLLVFVASFVKAGWKITRFDVLCGSLSVSAIVLWLITGKGTASILLSVAADFMAALPTVVKAYKTPKTESAWAYFGSSVAGIITLFTVKEWIAANYAFALYIALNMGLIALLVAFPRLRWPAKRPKAT